MKALWFVGLEAVSLIVYDFRGQSIVEYADLTSISLFTNRIREQIGYCEDVDQWWPHLEAEGNGDEHDCELFTSFRFASCLSLSNIGVLTCTGKGMEWDERRGSCGTANRGENGHAQYFNLNRARSHCERLFLFLAYVPLIPPHVLFSSPTSFPFHPSAPRISLRLLQNNAQCVDEVKLHEYWEAFYM